MVPRNFNPTKLLQVRREPLGVEQHEFASAQMLHQRHESNLRGIGHSMKHRFAKKRAAHRYAVKSAGELAVLPCSDRVRVAEFMQLRIALDDLLIDPRIFAFCAGLDHFRKRAVDSYFKNFLAQETP